MAGVPPKGAPVFVLLEACLAQCVLACQNDQACIRIHAHASTRTSSSLSWNGLVAEEQPYRVAKEQLYRIPYHFCLAPVCALQLISASLSAVISWDSAALHMQIL